MTAKPANPTAQPEFHFGPPTIAPRGDGSFVVTPGKPVPGVEEITTRQACAIIGVCRAQMWYIRETALGRKHLRWRFISEKRGKILWQKPSVLAYKESTEQLGK